MEKIYAFNVTTTISLTLYIINEKLELESSINVIFKHFILVFPEDVRHLNKIEN